MGGSRYSGRLAVGLLVAAVSAALWVVSTQSSASSSPPKQDLTPFHVPPGAKVAGRAGAASQMPAQTNALFVPVAPCRVATAAKGGPLKPKKSRTYRVAGATSYASQGGSSHGCGIPASATAVAVNLTATATTKNGYLRAWASGTPAPAARVLSYVRKQAATGSGTIGLGASDGRLVVGNAGGQAKVEVDVTGYYLPQMHAMISPASSSDSTHNAPIYAGSSRVVSAKNPQDGVYVVTFDSPVTYCTPVVDTYNAGEGIYGAAYAFSGNTATVFTWYLDGGHEKPFSYYFYIDIVC